MISALVLITLKLLSFTFNGQIADHGCYSVQFETTNTHPPFVPPAGHEFFGDIFERGLNVLPESILVQTVVAGGETVGVSKSQQEKLLPLFRDTYAAIADDKNMASIKSALPYCLSANEPKHGHYFLYVPEKVSERTRTIVFLHGFGGNFLFYLKVLKDEFPDHILILPSWGESWANGNSKYIRQVYDDIQERFSISIRESHLMSISGSGAISFHIYNTNAGWFTDLVILASMPANETIPHLSRDLNILMINGTHDNRFPIEIVRERAQLVTLQVPKSRLVELPSDHFFFLSDTQKWCTAVRKHLKY